MSFSWMQNEIETHEFSETPISAILEVEFNTTQIQLLYSSLRQRMTHSSFDKFRWYTSSHSDRFIFLSREEYMDIVKRNSVMLFFERFNKWSRQRGLGNVTYLLTRPINYSVIQEIGLTPDDQDLPF